MLTYLAIARRYQPRWLVWENVPGVLSSNGGRDFAAFIGGLEECGYHAAWRVLDAQFVRVDGFGRAVPQRRRRVFVVGYLGDWRRAAAVLLERESLSGNSAPRRQAGQGTSADVVSSLTASGRGVERAGETRGQDPVIAWPVQVAPTLNAHFGDKMGLEDQHALNGAGLFVPQPVAFSIMPQNSGKDYKARQVDVAQPIMAGGPVGGNQGGDYLLQPVAFSCKDHGADAGPISPTLRSMGHDGSHANGGGQLAVAFAQNSRDEVRLFDGDGGIVGALAAEPGMKQTTYVATHDVAGTMKSCKTSGGFSNSIDHAAGGYMAMQGWAVRRLTPTECERLQGFPDSFTTIPYPIKPAADGPRYKALGNSMAVNAMRWIGQRIAIIDAIPDTAKSRAAA